MSDFLDGVLHPERAAATRRPTWMSLVGLVLIPLLIGGLMVWALWKPDQRLSRIEAAVVNQDQPVQVGGKTVPLGRQLAAALVTASGAPAPSASTSPSASPSPAASAATGAAADVSGHESTSNFTWVVTSAADAASGLADGRYATVVTIPPGFSAAATSVGTDPSHAQQATLDIATSDRSRPVDAAVAQVVTSTAVRLLSGQLTTTYLQNVFVGFDTLRTNLGKASDGASQLATGASSLSSGASSVSTGASQLASGVGQLATGASSAAAGAKSLASGVGALATGATSLASGLDTLAAGASSGATQAQAGVPGAQQLATGLDQLNAGVNGTGGLAQGVAALSTGATGLKTGLTGFGQQATALAQACQAAQPGACSALAAFVDPSGVPNTPGASTAPNLAYLSAAAGQVESGAAGLDAAVNVGTGTTPSLASSAAALATGGQQLAAGVAASASGLQQLATGAQQSAAGAHRLAAGVQQSAAGASSLSSGIASLAGGAQQSAAGASSLAAGAGQIATGATGLGSGATTLAGGLGSAAGQVPSYSADQAGRLAQVVADPVAASGAGTTSFFAGASVPFVLVVALWLGGLASFVVLGATAPRVVGSTRTSLRLAVTSFVPGALVGAVQGLALTAAMAGALTLTPGGWAAFAAVAALAGIAFAAVNQGLVAAFRGTGRFAAVIVAVVGLATAVVSTVPRLLDAVAGALPLAPARAAMQAVVTGDSPAGSVALLVVWAVVGVALTTASVARRRVVPAGRLARWARAA